MSEIEARAKQYFKVGLANNARFARENPGAFQGTASRQAAISLCVEISSASSKLASLLMQGQSAIDVSLLISMVGNLANLGSIMVPEEEGRAWENSVRAQGAGLILPPNHPRAS